MNFDRINEQLQKTKTTKKIEDIHTLIGFLLESFVTIDANQENLIPPHSSVQREISRFMPAQGYRNQAAAYEIKHQSEIPLDIKLFWLKKTTKANLSWVMALTPNYEDNPETNANLNIGMDIVVSENCDSVFVVLSNNLKARVLELSGSLSLTQREIFDNWVKIGRTINRESENFKKEFHTLLWKSFDFEPINRKFYLQLVEQFDHLVGHITKTITDQEKAKMFAVRLIGRTLFLWFLRKKEFVNPEFDYFTVSGDVDQTQYYRKKLEPLFFEVLNTEIKDRSFADKITPFLNGGLFEPIETDFYKDTKLTFPTGFFTQFFNVLNHYNFTVDEGTSEYEQVAVDPEMLGRVFENLLASINPNTSTNARNANGAFYTPREVVDYMCEQSLVEYLKTKFPDTANRDRRIEELVTMDEASFREQDHNKRRDWKKDLGQDQVLQALDELKILDPAVGSGAFPMGMLNLLVKVYTRIDTTREKDLTQLKRDILSQSLYGVDIDQMAIQISRLRAWLSILVDMENLKKVEPLPNLDFKFVCANTLIPLDDESNGLFDGDVNLKDNLIKLRDQYYAVTRKTDKEKIRKEYLKLINTGSLFASPRELQLKDYNPFNPLNSSGFYDPTLMHGVEAFDVVIGNPPYILEDDNRDAFNGLRNSPYYEGKTDIWHIFTCKNIEILKEEGIISFIAKNQWLESFSASKMRECIYKKTNIKWIVDFGANLIFDQVGQQTMIFLLRKNSFVKDHQIVYKKCLASFERIDIKNLPKVVSTSDKVFYAVKNIQADFDPKENLTFSSISNEIILDKIQSKRNFSFNEKEIIQGIIGGPDKAFIISENELSIFNNFERKFIFKIHTNTKKYQTPDSNKYIFYIHKNNFTEDDLRNSPNIKNKLTQYEEVLKNRREVLNDRISWFHLWWPRDEKFFIGGAKIVFAARTNSSNFTYTEDPFYGSRNLFFLKSDRVNLKYLISLLNSRLMFFYMGERLKHTGDLLQIDKNQFFKIPIFIPSDVSVIEKTVDHILGKKKNNINADISDLESQIDELVMNLYGLNEKEKEIIRSS